MSTIRYNDGQTRDSETMCNHCKGNCVCPGTKWSINASPGCGGGTCCCPETARATPAPALPGVEALLLERAERLMTKFVMVLPEAAYDAGCKVGVCKHGHCEGRRWLADLAALKVRP